jgi:hypothetical protein
MQFPDSLSANGADTGGVWVRVTDQFGNGVRSGIPVTFSTTLGTFSGSSVTRNIARVPTALDMPIDYNSIVSPGIATLSASAGSGAIGYATVFMQALTADSLALRVNPRRLLLMVFRRARLLP